MICKTADALLLKNEIKTAKSQIPLYQLLIPTPHRGDHRHAALQFTFREFCSYILYCAMEEGCTATNGFYDSNQLSANDYERVSSILEKIVGKRRKAVAFEEENIESVKK